MYKLWFLPKKTCIDLLFQFRMLLVYFYFWYNSIKYESSSLEDEKIMYVQRQIFQNTFRTCLLHFRIFFVYVWFLKQFKYICLKFFGKSRNNVYVCFILESFLFTFGLWNNWGTFVLSSLKNQEIMYMTASF